MNLGSGFAVAQGCYGSGAMSVRAADQARDRRGQAAATDALVCRRFRRAEQVLLPSEGARQDRGAALPTIGRAAYEPQWTGSRKDT